MLRIPLLISIVFMSLTVQAQGIHKCTGTDGKTSYSDRPCAGAAAAKPPSPAPEPARPSAQRKYEKPAPGSEGEAFEQKLKNGCDKGTREYCELLQDIRAGVPHLDALAAASKRSCARGDKDACDIYCREDPSSSQCLQRTGKASGATWFQLGEPSRHGGGVTISCRDPALASDSNSVFTVQCETGECRHAAIPGQPFRRFSTLETAAADGCQQVLLARRNRK